MYLDRFVDAVHKFNSYFDSKGISPSISKRFIPDLYEHIGHNKKSFLFFYEFIEANRDNPIEETIEKLNLLISKKEPGYKTFIFVSDYSHSYLGPGEIICLLLIGESYSGKKKNPDILFKGSKRIIEVKSYIDNFRLTESTSFFTDLGTIIQALVQGGFMSSLTEINNNDLRKGIRHFCESFLCPRGYIELNSKIWKLESKTEQKIVFKSSPETPREIIKYSIVRNSLRNWLSRGTLSIKLAEIIDPTRTARIQRKELTEYVNHLFGFNDLTSIPLEQYFTLCNLESIIIYERKNKTCPFQIYKYKDLSIFTLDRVSQAKVSYKKKKLKTS